MATDVAWDSLLARYDTDDAFVAIVDHDFVVRAASTAATIDLAPTSLLGKCITDLIHPDDLLRALEVFDDNDIPAALRPPNVYRFRIVGKGGYRRLAITGETVLAGTGVALHLREPTDRVTPTAHSLAQIDIFEMMGSGRSLTDCLLALVVMVERNSGGGRAIVHIADNNDRLQPVASGGLAPAIIGRHRDVLAEAPGEELARALGDGPRRIDTEAIAGFSSVSVSPARRADGAIAGYLEVLHPTAAASSTDAPAERLASQLIGLLVDRYALEALPTETAFFDEVTALPNRRALQSAAVDLDRDQHGFGLLALDIDDFGVINSTDHREGERALVAVSQALHAVLPERAKAFRSGGDEFVVIVPDERRSEALAAVGQKILDHLDDELVDPDTASRRVSVSVGATTHDASVGHRPFSELLEEADTAMCVAKRDGGHQVRIHDQPLDNRWVHRRALAESMPAAIDGDQLHLEFQPIVSLSSHYVVGFEALSRWNHPRFGVLTPGDFLPIAEETSLIHAVDSWALDTAARQVAKWKVTAGEPLDVWVNVSSRSLAHPDLVDQIKGLRRRHGVAIGVELTERDSFASSLHADRACAQLRTAGIKLALDDFGVGRASLFRAVFHTPAVVKIDRSFVSGMLESEQMMATVATILDLGRQLGIIVIAEGVESEAQMRQLDLMGCEFAQGYLFAPPLTADAIEDRLGPDFADRRIIKLSAPHEARDHLDV